MAHAQKPDFPLSPKRTSPFKSAGASAQSTADSRGVRISGSNAGYTTFRSSVKSTGYPLHSPVSPSLPLPCVTVCHQVSNALCTKSVDQTALRVENDRPTGNRERQGGVYVCFIDRSVD